MNVLIACEESQRICVEFRSLGHTAFSCDIQECSGGHPEWHILGDAIPILDGDCEFVTQDGQPHHQVGEWDLIIAHPPCTYLTISGNRYFDIDRYGEKAIDRYKKRDESVEFFMKFINAKCKRIAVENPIGFISTIYREPDCVVQPYDFGDRLVKKTCFWLKNLPPLRPTNRLELEKTGNRYEYSGALYYAVDESGKILQWSDPRTAKERSKTPPGMAKAIAEQWSSNLPPIISEINIVPKKLMNILVVCEESQRVCKSFRSKGHRAFSCDMQVCSGGYPEWHIRDDASKYLDGNCEFVTEDGVRHTQIGEWDLIVAHPPCTYLAKGGAVRVFRREEKYYPSYGTFQMVNVERVKQGILARDFFMKIYNAKCERIAIENPVPMGIFMLPQVTQIIEPYQFGEPYQKQTCLWLKGLPKLQPTNVVVPTLNWVSGGSKNEDGSPREMKSGTSRRAKRKSKTFAGIAAAMADQWSFEALENIEDDIG